MRNKQAGRARKIWPLDQFAALNRLFSLVFFFSHCFNALTAQEIQFEHLTVNDGLAHSDAMDIVQDSDGFIWIATNNGVDRHDGYGLKHYRMPPSNPSGVTSNRVHVLFVDLSGLLWVGTENAGIYYYDQRTDQFNSPAFNINRVSHDQLLKKLHSSNIKSITMDQRHRMWVATMKHGVFCLQTSRGGVISSIQNVALGPTGDLNYAATSVFVNISGQVWIGTLDSGLWMVGSIKQHNRGRYMATEIQFIPDKKIRVLQLDKKGNFWIASDHSIYRIQQGTSDLRHEIRKVPLRVDDIQCLYSDSFGRLWIGSNSGLKMIENVEKYLNKPTSQSIHHYAPDGSDPSGINSARIHRIMQDNFGNLWLAASDGGVNKIRLQAKGFHNLNRSVSKKKNNSQQFC